MNGLDEYEELIKSQVTSTLSVVTEGLCAPGPSGHVHGLQCRRVSELCPEEINSLLDYAASYKLWDPSHESPSEFTILNTFKKEIERIPIIECPTVIHCTQCRVQKYGMKPQLLSPNKSTLTLLDNKPPIDIQSRIVFLLYKSFLAKTGGGSIPPLLSTSHRSTPQPQLNTNHFQKRKKIIELSNLASPYFDLTCELLEEPFYHNGMTSRTTLQVTDYTQEYSLNNNAPSTPFMITLWDVHSERCRMLNPHKGVLMNLLNLKMKTSNEAGMHQVGNDKIGVHLIDVGDPLAEDLLAAKRVYYIKTGKFPPTRSAQESALKCVTFKDLENIQVSGGVFKIRGCVADHLPPDLQAFSRRWCIECDATVPINDVRGVCACGRRISQDSFKWLFAFLLTNNTNGHPYIPVVIEGSEATQFLGVRPGNLYEDMETLNMLKERLNVLWEVKDVDDITKPLDNARLLELEISVRDIICETMDNERKYVYTLQNTVINY